MFAVIYQFEVKSGKESAFRAAWKDLTSLIYQNCGSLGSRLHSSNAGTYIAYAQWSNREQWKNASAYLPEHSAKFSTAMRSACTEIKVLYELEMMEDLLKDAPFNSSKIH